MIRSSSIFAKIVGWEEEGKETFPFNTGKNKYDFIDVDDFPDRLQKQQHRMKYMELLIVAQATLFHWRISRRIY